MVPCYLNERYSNKIIFYLDYLAYTLYYPWATCLSLVITCFVSSLKEKQQPYKKLLDYFIFGPTCIFLLIVFFPLGLLGLFLWFIICSTCFQEKYSYISNYNTLNSNENNYTFCTANVLLGPECLNHLNNNTSAYSRADKIAQKILNQSGKPLTNIQKTFNLRHSVITNLPNIDFLCLQEVWERFHAKVLIKYLQKDYPYILYDIGEYKWNINLCLFGSGLMLASKHPILNADFKTFSFRTQHAKCATQGILCVKVLLRKHDDGSCAVGYISNLHTQAFQGTEPCIYRQLSESVEFIDKFKRSSASANDHVLFDVVCGDFNADNMSPADMDIQGHEIFTIYEDPCCLKQGADHDWAIGTELRQAMLYTPQMSSPDLFRKMLISDSFRRKFVLDANVLIHSHELMTSIVEPHNDGHVPIEPYGGKRRVDRLLVKRNSPSCRITGYAFSTALANMTDHLLVCMSISTNQH